jgi:gliding motility-associated-like protein
MFYLKNKSPMFKPFLPIFIILFIGFSVAAQTPEPLRGIYPTLGTRSTLAACTGAASSGKTTQTLGVKAKTKNKLFLCSGDSLFISNTNANLSEDPKPATTAGIGYFFYNCPPTVAGPRWSDVIKDACLRTTQVAGRPSPTTARGDATGRDTFVNTGGLQTAFNTGKPLKLFFASATIYDFFNLDGEGDTACVNVGTPADTFSVVYLNPVRISNLTYANRAGSFKVTGGLPEYNGSTYTFTIVKTTDPTKVGTIVGTPTNGATLTFTVPEDGAYIITGTDGVSCDGTARVVFPTVTLRLSNEKVTRSGDTACVRFTATNFTNVSTLQFWVAYNSTQLRYVGIKTINIPGFTAAGNVNLSQDTLNVSWFDLNGITRTDNSTLFEVCFKTLAPDGSLVPVRFGDPTDPFLNITVEDPSGTPYGVDTTHGSIKIGSLPVNVRLAADSLKCNKDNSGEINIIPTGTGAPFSYSWQSKANPLINGAGSMVLNDTGKITSLAAGIYYVTITSVGNDVKKDSIEVKEPAALFANPPVAVNPCQNATNGSLTLVNFGGGTGPYSFLWSTGGTTAKISNLAQGSYSCTVSDTKRCTTTVQGSIGTVPIIVTGKSITPAKCFGAFTKTGAIAITTVTGGSPIGGNYDFTWNTVPPATQTGATSAVNNLEPGLYKVTISDKNCTAVDSFTVTAERTLELLATITNVTCNAANTGTVLVTASARGTSNPPYVFNWTGINAGDITKTPATTLVRNLKAGKYLFNMSDQDGCRLDSTFTITEPSAITPKVVSIKNESCLVGGDGEIAVSVSGGTVNATGYTYQWSRNLTDNQATISKLFAGTYKLTVKDNAQCEKDTNFVITVPQKPKLALSIKDATCSDKADGEVKVTVTPPTGATITGYSWNNTGITNMISQLKADTYRVTVSLSNGCLKDTFAVVGSPAPLMVDTANSSVRNPTCTGYDDGQITLVMKGGTSPYVYTWSGGQPTGKPVFGSLKAAVYNFSIVDFNKCGPLQIPIALIAPPDILVAFTEIEGTKCFGKCVLNKSDGKARANATGGPANTGIYTFLWESGETTAKAVELCGGWQTVVVSDGICTKKDSVDIPQPLPFTFATPIIEEPSCKGLKDGRAEVLLTGGTPPYAYNWSTGSVTKDIVNVVAGKYTIIVTDANLCEASPLTVAINEPLSFKLDTLPEATNNVSCNGLSDGKITLYRVGGNGGATTYTWSNNPSNTTNVSDKLKAGIYYVTATDRKGCRDSITFNVLQPDKIYYFLEPPVSPRCYGELTFVKLDTAFGSTYMHAFTVSVDNGPQFPIGYQVPVFADNHLITITETITGCSDTLSVTISQPPPITVRFADIVDSVPIPRILVGLGTEVRLNPIITGALPIDSISWTPKDYLATSSEPLRPLVRPLDDKTYKLRVKDVNGCIGEGEILVELERNRNIFIPNVFSPNGDDKNDYFGAFAGVGVKNINFIRIFDRWGELMFQTTNIVPSGDPSSGWNGTFKGAPVHSGVYVYIVEVEFEDGAKLLYRGDVTLVR